MSAAKTAVQNLEVNDRLPLSEVTDPPDKSRNLTREKLVHLNVAYWWLAELGEKYAEQAEALGDIYYFCERILDIEAGIEQGYLDQLGRPIPKVV